MWKPRETHCLSIMGNKDAKGSRGGRGCPFFSVFDIEKTHLLGKKNKQSNVKATKTYEVLGGVKLNDDLILKTPLFKGLNMRRKELPKRSFGYAYSDNDICRYFELHRNVLGRGTYGIVITGTHRASKQVYAIKVVKKRTFQRQETAGLFYKEVDCAQLLRHPNIVQWCDCFEDDYFCYGVLELCTGGDLFNRLLHASKCTELDIVVYVRQMLLAVQHCHNNRIIHRDIKDILDVHYTYDVSSATRPVEEVES